MTIFIKSFFKNRFVKISIIVLTLALMVIFSLNLYQNHLIKIGDTLNNRNNKLILMGNKANYEKIKNIKTIKEITLEVTAYYNENNLLFTTNFDSNIKDDEIILNGNNFSNFTIGDKIKIRLIDKYYEFTIKDILNSSYNNSKAIINGNLFFNMTDNINVYKMTIEVNKYSDINNTIEAIKRTKFNSRIDILEDDSDEPNVEKINNKISIVKVDFFKSIFIIATGIIIYFIGMIILFDNKELNYLYKFLGYTKLKIFLINTFKILSVLVASLVIGLIYYGIIFLIFK